MEPGGRPPAERASSGMPLPGPGTYSHTTNNVGGGYLGDAPMYTMGARKILAKPDDASPGPVYSPRSAGQTGDAPQYTFGTARKDNTGRSRTPGPGDYTTTTNSRGASSMGDSPRYGFGTSPQREATHSPRGNRCAWR